MNSLFGGKGGRIPPPTRKLVIRKANSQRDLRPISERLSLEKVLGITSTSSAALACSPVSGIIAYPAGCIVVLFNPRRSQQEFIHNVSKKTITTVAFSKDGKYLASGESGHMPSVRVWNLEEPNHSQISEMAKGHKHGVACVAFSPNMKYLVSVGYQHDMLINVWNWRDGSKVGSNKISTKVYAISFSEVGNFFVTSGVRHVKFWYMDTESAKLTKHDKTLPIKGRAGILGELRNQTFCDVACGVGDNSDYTYCVTTSGALCSFNAKRKLEQFIELGSSKALSMAVNEKYIICGYTNGFIRVFDPSSLQFIATLPKPHFLGVNVADGIDPSHMIAKTDDVMYADTVALTLDSTHHWLTCVYNDHSLYVWDITDIKKVGKIWSSLFHSGCVWGLEVYPELQCLVGDIGSPLPPGTFLTCSNDDTVRVWNVVEGTNISSVKNIYSKELLRVLYMDKSYSGLKDNEMSPTSKNVRDASTEGKGGVRTIRASPDGQYLAVGERSGNVRVYDCMFLDEILNIDAHESEVLCVEFSPPESGYKLLASAGRDRLIHIFDIKKEFSLIQTLDDHSASITSVKFNVDDGEFQLLSCGADKSVIFRSAQCNPDLQFIRSTNYVGKTTLYDMVIDSSRSIAAIACQDRNVRVYDTGTGKQSKCYKGAQGDDGTLVKITMDNSGYYTATSCSDKTLSLHEYDTGECVATMSGHSEIVTGMRFTNDLKRLITVSGDGCIFIWTIPTTYIQNMTDRLCEMGQEPPRELHPETPLRRGTYRVENSHTVSSDLNGFGSPSQDFLSGKLEPNPPIADYRFSIGQLPSWAKKQIIAESGASPVPSEPDTGGPSQPGGRWAQRVNNGELHVVSESSPQRPITLSLDLGSTERKKFSTGAASFQDHVNALANSPLERKCSLTTGEDEDLFPVNGISQLDDLEEEDNAMRVTPSGAVPVGVTLSRGGELARSRPRTWTGDKLIIIETEEIKFEEAEQSKDDDSKDCIIYFPPAEDDMDTEHASHSDAFPSVKRMTRHFESLQATATSVTQPHQHSAIRNLDNTRPERRTKHDSADDNLDFVPVKIEKLARSFQVTAAQKPQRRSVGDDDETEEKPEKENKRKKTESSSDEEDDPLSALDDIKIDGTEDDITASDKSENPDDDNEEELCRKYFDCLGSTPTKEKPAELDERPATPVTKTESSLPFLNGRLSISARFLSRSLLTSSRIHDQHYMDSFYEESDADKARAASLEEHKQEIQKRKEDMARAVDANRKRLTALRKAKEERENRNVSPSQELEISSVAITLKPSPRRTSREFDHPKPPTISTSLPVTIVPSNTRTSAGRLDKLLEPVSSLKPQPTTPKILFPVGQPKSRLDLDTQPVQLETAPMGTKTPASDNSVTGGTMSRSPAVTNLFETRLSTVPIKHGSRDQLVPERDDNVWIKRDHDKTAEVSGCPAAALRSLLNQAKSTDRTDTKKAASQELNNTYNTDKGCGKQDEAEKVKMMAREKAKQEEFEKYRKKEREIEKEKRKRRELEKTEEEKREKVRQRQLQIEKAEEKREMEKQKQREIEKIEDEKKEKERQKQLQFVKAEEEREKEKQKQREIEKIEEENREKEREKQSQFEKAEKEKREKEKQMQREIEKNEEEKREKERKNQLQFQKAEEEKRETEKKKQIEIEKVKGEEELKEKEKAKEREEQKVRERKLDKEKDKKDEKEKGKTDSSGPGKLDKRGSSSSLMAQTKSSWRKNLGFGGFSTKTKEKKDERRISAPFASTLRSSEHSAQPAKRSEKVLFREKRGKVPLEDRKLKSKSLGDLESRLKPLREEIILDPTVPPTHVVSTADIPDELAKTDSRTSSPKKSPDRREAENSTMESEDDTSAVALLKDDGAKSPLPFSDRRSPIGKDEDVKSASKLKMYQDAVSQLNQAFKSITDLHSQVLEEDNSDDKEHMLSLMTQTFTDMEKHCKHQRLQVNEAACTPRNPALLPKPLSGNLSYSMGSIAAIREDESADQTRLNRRASEACVPTAVEDEAASRDLLMRYSDILVEMVKQKLSN